MPAKDRRAVPKPSSSVPQASRAPCGAGLSGRRTAAMSMGIYTSRAKADAVKVGAALAAMDRAAVPNPVYPMNLEKRARPGRVNP